MKKNCDNEAEYRLFLLKVSILFPVFIFVLTCCLSQFFNVQILYFTSSIKLIKICTDRLKLIWRKPFRN